MALVPPYSGGVQVTTVLPMPARAVTFRGESGARRLTVSSWPFSSTNAVDPAAFTRNTPFRLPSTVRNCARTANVLGLAMVSWLVTGVVPVKNTRSMPGEYPTKLPAGLMVPSRCCRSPDQTWPADVYTVLPSGLIATLLPCAEPDGAAWLTVGVSVLTSKETSAGWLGAPSMSTMVL